MKAKLIRWGLSVLFGALGMAAVLLAVHLWNDHQALHQLINIEIQREQAMRQMSPAQPGK